MLIMLEQLKTSVVDLQTQCQCNNTLLQWIVAKFGGQQETINLTDDVVLPGATLEDVHRIEHLFNTNADIRKKVVSTLLCYFYLTRDLLSRVFEVFTMPN